jgi:hypothetical protein
MVHAPWKPSCNCLTDKGVFYTIDFFNMEGKPPATVPGF